MAYVVDKAAAVLMDAFKVVAAFWVYSCLTCCSFLKNTLSSKFIFFLIALEHCLILEDQFCSENVVPLTLLRFRVDGQDCSYAKGWS